MPLEHFYEQFLGTAFSNNYQQDAKILYPALKIVDLHGAFEASLAVRSSRPCHGRARRGRAAASLQSTQAEQRALWQSGVAQMIHS
jgi:hypothetical protein